MAVNLGKKFEEQFRKDFMNIPNCSLDRLYDSTSGYRGIMNISDFIGYVYPNIYYLEIKSIKGKSFPISNLTQYPKLIEKCGIKGVRTGVVIWYYEIDRVVYVPIATVSKLLEDDIKSINIEKIDREKYFILDIPSVKKRTFMTSDYNVLLTLEEGM